MASSLPPRLPAGERLRRAGIAAWSIIGIAILLALLFWVLLKIRVIFPPLVLALLIIYLVNPLVTRFEQRGVPRVLGVLLSYVIVVGSITLLVIALAPFVSRQVSELADQLPAFRDDIVDFANDFGEGVEERTGIALPIGRFACLMGADRSDDSDLPTRKRCDRVTTDFREQITAQAGRITEIGLGVLEALLVFVLAPLIALYLLIDLPQVQRDILRLVPESHRAEAADLGSKMGRAVGGFFRGQLFVAILVGLLSAVGFRLIGLPFWFLIGAIAGFFNLIPLVGPFIGGTLGFLIGTMTGGIGLGLRAALVELVVQQIDNHFISPAVMSRIVKLHPATVMLSLLAGGTLAGFWGILLAVPAMAVIKLLASHFWTTRVLGSQPSPFVPTAAGGAPSPVVAGGEDASDEDEPDPGRLRTE